MTPQLQLTSIPNAIVTTKITNGLEFTSNNKIRHATTFFNHLVPYVEQGYKPKLLKYNSRKKEFYARLESPKK